MLRFGNVSILNGILEASVERRAYKEDQRGDIEKRLDWRT